MAGEGSPLVIIGGGGHAVVVAEALALSGQAAIGYIAPEAAERASKVLGEWLGNDDAIDALAADGARFVLGLGFVDAAGAARRRRLLGNLSTAQMPVALHPSAVVSRSAHLDDGVFVGAGAIVGPGAVVERAAIINSGAIVEHDCRIGANTHIATGSQMGGNVSIGADCLIGLGAVLRQGVTIGDGAVVGAGAVVVSDAAHGAMVLGVPARQV
ncbi:UDP-N-acetylbacillosamine N-acetyltransferase [Defluviimonas aquaemixtae]|uniref:UDP-N-acetylbacillosamine N-acetyltransferase n=1 Tax=Albidovulum aquaemixtae TaxID=1542388 RepID=A0A2R8B2T3_9RHOB|nr:NeuD/PglB/VioB family sugar acetyltransferase [Defluviimonas aquaemixtae]SPH16882.1 UDP-N-acetylbacillosamine N-acetyltransferase [Defluviimonas aquaemixtae]